MPLNMASNGLMQEARQHVSIPNAVGHGVQRADARGASRRLPCTYSYFAKP